jgi:hypothetical protein
MRYDKNYDDYPKIWTNNTSRFLSASKKKKLNNSLAETIVWTPMSPNLKDELESIKIDINLTGNPKQEVLLHTIIDNIHYTEKPNPHITVEFVDGSSFNYFINDKDDDDVRKIPVHNHRNANDPYADKLIKTNNFYMEKIKLLEILSKIINRNEFRKYFGLYYEKSKGKNIKKQRTRKKPKPKKQRTRTKPKKQRSRAKPKK